MLEVRKRRKKLALRNEKWGDPGGGRKGWGDHVAENMRGKALLQKAGTFASCICRYFLQIRLYTQCRHICREMEEWVDGWVVKWRHKWVKA